MSRGKAFFVCGFAALLLLGEACAGKRGRAPAVESNAWRVHPIAPQSRFEAAGAADFDRDGHVDVFSGDAWYRGPSWARVRVRTVPPSPSGQYHEDFADLPLDVNGDGRTDVVTCAYFSGRLAWLENPPDPAAPWPEHEIATPGPSETCLLADLDGDGDLDLLPNTVERALWYEFRAGGSPPFVAHALGKGGHGIGAADVDGDGRLDVLSERGWFRAPARPRDEPWEHRSDWELGKASIPIVGADVDGDGDTDLVWGAAHDYGIRWMPQAASTRPGAITFGDAKLVEGVVSQIHAPVWTDLGWGPVLVAGKRIYAHMKEPGATEAPFIAAYRFGAGSWTRTVLYAGTAAAHAPDDERERDAMKDFAPGSVGTGLALEAVDLDGDGDRDLLCPGKTGLYFLENPLRGGR